MARVGRCPKAGGSPSEGAETAPGETENSQAGATDTSAAAARARNSGTVHYDGKLSGPGTVHFEAFNLDTTNRTLAINGVIFGKLGLSIKVLKTSSVYTVIPGKSTRFTLEVSAARVLRVERQNDRFDDRHRLRRRGGTRSLALREFAHAKGRAFRQTGRVPGQRRFHSHRRRQMSSPVWRRFLTMAVFESSLLGLAIALSRLTQTPLNKSLRSTPEGWVAALFLAAVFFLAFRWTYNSALPIFRKIRKFLDESASPLFFGFRLPALAAVSLLAGVGEEALFRGWLQSWLEGYWGAVPACLAAAVAFGVAHSITRGYAACAALIGVALGALQLYSGGWLAPAFAHALYDFVALAWYLRGNLKKI